MNFESWNLETGWWTTSSLPKSLVCTHYFGSILKNNTPQGFKTSGLAAPNRSSPRERVAAMPARGTARRRSCMDWPAKRTREVEMCIPSIDGWVVFVFGLGGGTRFGRVYREAKGKPSNISGGALILRMKLGGRGSSTPGDLHLSLNFFLCNQAIGGCSKREFSWQPDTCLLPWLPFVVKTRNMELASSFLLHDREAVRIAGLGRSPDLKLAMVLNAACEKTPAKFVTMSLWSPNNVLILFGVPFC